MDKNDKKMMVLKIAKKSRFKPQNLILSIVTQDGEKKFQKFFLD